MSVVCACAGQTRAYFGAMRLTAPRGPPPPLLPLLPLPLLILLLHAGSTRSETLGTLGAILPPFLRNNFEELVKTASDSCEVLPLEVLYSRQYTSELPLIEVVEFTRSGSSARRLAQAGHQLKLRPKRPLLLYVPGWWNTPTDESSAALVSALLRKHRSVLVMDTRLCFCRGYIGAASRVNPLAHLIYDFINKVHDRGVPLSSIHLIGFSLGSHVAGITGKLVQKKLGSKIGRITALDPAKPCFMKSLDYRLDKNDAEFVQVVHSSAGVLGLEQPVGHADVYMNGVAGAQPECRGKGISLECDHAQAWRLYAASVADATALAGRACDDWDALRLRQCQGNATALGYGCDRSARGLFLYTSSADRLKRDEPEMKVFNLFDLRTWWN